jgi:hypothetical protein
MPTKSELIREIGGVLGVLGAEYANSGARDKHYGVWLFAMILDAAGNSASLRAVDGSGAAVFRGKPADLDNPARYTYGLVEAASLVGGARGSERHWRIRRIARRRCHGVAGDEFRSSEALRLLAGGFGRRPWNRS